MLDDGDWRLDGLMAPVRAAQASGSGRVGPGSICRTDRRTVTARSLRVAVST